MLRGLAAARPVLLLAVFCLAVLASSQSLGQGVHHPFAVGANEGAAGSAQGVSGWILAREAGFYRLLSGAIRAAKQSGVAAWGLAGLSLAYGIFHAAGPGHGKMVIASYMLANERALRRGLVIAFGAALLQGFSAVAIVGIGGLTDTAKGATCQSTMDASRAGVAAYYASQSPNKYPAAFTDMTAPAAPAQPTLVLQGGVKNPTATTLTDNGNPVKWTITLAGGGVLTSNLANCT